VHARNKNPTSSGRVTKNSTSAILLPDW
jgi:hypothetical protein